MFDFPKNPSEGDIYSPPSGPSYVWNDPVWNVVPAGGGGGGSTDWDDITDKPATFPPTLPIAESDVTNLVTDLAAKEPSLPAGGTTSDFLRGDKTWAVPAGGGGGIPEAPTDSKLYARFNSAWNDLTDDFAAKANLAGATFTGKVTVPASVTGGAGFNLGGASAAPSAPVDGDVWVSSNVLNYRDGATTRQAVAHNTTQTITGTKTFSASPILPTPTAGDNSTKGATTAYVDTADALDAKLAGATFTGKVTAKVGDASGAGLNIPSGTPTGPVQGDLWMSGSTFSYRGAASNYVFANLEGSQTFSGAKTFSASPILPTPTAGDNSTKGATTAYADAAVAAKIANKITVASSAPSSPATNDLWVDTT